MSADVVVPHATPLVTLINLHEGTDRDALWVETKEESGAFTRYAVYLVATPSATPEQAPIDMVLHCPKCHVQHIDNPDWCPVPSQTEFAHLTWTNPPHRSHLCHGCGHIWRPADVPTNGVLAVKTTGKADSPIAHPQGEPAPQEQREMQQRKRMAERFAGRTQLPASADFDLCPPQGEPASQAHETARLRAAIKAVCREAHSATRGIVDLHIIDGETDTQKNAPQDCGEAGCAEGRCGNASCMPSAAPAPQAPERAGAVAACQIISEAQIAQLEHAARGMEAIANKHRIGVDTIEPVRTINDAAKLAKVAHARVMNVLACLDLNDPSAIAGATEEFLEDVYEQCCNAIKPYVDKGWLPASVVESLEMLLERFALAQQVAPQAPAPAAVEIVHLWATEQETGKEMFMEVGPRGAMENKRDAMNQIGRDYWIKEDALPQGAEAADGSAS